MHFILCRQLYHQSWCCLVGQEEEEKGWQERKEQEERERKEKEGDQGAKRKAIEETNREAGEGKATRRAKAAERHYQQSEEGEMCGCWVEIDLLGHLRILPGHLEIQNHHQIVLCGFPCAFQLT